MVSAAEPAPTRRGVGKRAGLSVHRIVGTARAMSPESLTIQAVADELGVDRKAVRHHVRDLDTLLGLVALDAFADGSVDVVIPEDAGWQDTCRAFARSLVDSIIATGTLAGHLKTDDGLFDRFAEPTERVLSRLFEAGIDEEGALRAIALLVNICMGFARDALVVSRSGERPRRSIASRTLQHHAAGELPLFSRTVAMEIDTYDRKQLEISLDIFLAGVEQTLTLTQAGPTMARTP